MSDITSEYDKLQDFWTELWRHEWDAESLTLWLHTELMITTVCKDWNQTVEMFWITVTFSS